MFWLGSSPVKWSATPFALFIPQACCALIIYTAVMIPSALHLNEILTGKSPVFFHSDARLRHPGGSLVTPSIQKSKQEAGIWVSVCSDGSITTRPEEFESTKHNSADTHLFTRPALYDHHSFWVPYIPCCIAPSWVHYWLFYPEVDMTYMSQDEWGSYLKSDDCHKLEHLLEQVEVIALAMKKVVGLDFCPSSTLQLPPHGVTSWSKWIDSLKSARHSVLEWFGYINLILHSIGLEHWKSLSICVDARVMDRYCWQELILIWGIVESPMLGAIINVRSSPFQFPDLQEWVFHGVPFHYLWDDETSRIPSVSALNPLFYEVGGSYEVLSEWHIQLDWCVDAIWCAMGSNWSIPGYWVLLMHGAISRLMLILTDHLNALTDFLICIPKTDLSLAPIRKGLACAHMTPPHSWQQLKTVIVVNRIITWMTCMLYL